MNKPYILRTNPEYFNKILTYHNIEFNKSQGSEPYVKGYNDYNYIIDINTIFSSKPSGNIIDRTQTFNLPFNMHVARPWRIPNECYSFDTCVERRVHELTTNYQKINILWSGGIDSTCVLVGFLKHAKDLSQIRVLYSTLSIKENPNFFLILNKLDLELVDFSGDVYLHHRFDGVFVNGDGADDITASIDDSFFKKYGLEGLQRSWKDLFSSKMNDNKFIDFCQRFFDTAGRPIDTVLEARWWFYTNSKISKFPAIASELLDHNQPLVIGFFDNYDFEHYMFFNTDKILQNNYASYKQEFKQYIFNYDNNVEYLENKTKFNSIQIGYFRQKKIALNDLRYIIMLADGTRVRTNNLPFLSEKEYRSTYGNTLNYLFNV